MRKKETEIIKLREEEDEQGQTYLPVLRQGTAHA